jgi:TetR/AcrR family transcriptional repressor of nem operon
MTTNTNRAISDLAESLLQDKGFNDFSYAHIASELGVKNAAIHYHYPTKEDLSCAVVQRYRDRFHFRYFGMRSHLPGALQQSPKRAV